MLSNPTYKLIKFNTIDSTNLEARRLATKHPKEHYVIWSDMQSAGRGRNNRKWVSLPGNLFMSILFPHNYTYSNLLTTLSLVTGLSIICSLEKFCNTKLEVKWPNDIMLHDKKLAGILLENLHYGNLSYLIIGIGVNVENYNDLNDQPTTSLYKEGYNVGLLDLLDSIVQSFDYYKTKWELYGFSEMKKLWLSKAYKLNQVIKVNYDGTIQQGIFHGIDNNGALLLKCQNKIISHIIH